MKLLGWKDKMDLPELGLHKVPLKVDTGARTSVLHCQFIKLVRRDKELFVKFKPLDSSFPSFNNEIHVFPFHKESRIKNSFGQEENRFVINTIIRLYNTDYPIEISLRDRSNLEFPFLLGRNFVKHKFIIDVTQRNLSYKSSRKKI